MLIKDFVTTMQAGDHKGLSDCFSDRCRLFDYTPISIGRENAYIYGCHAVDMYTHNSFVLQGYKMLDPQIVDERSVDFYASFRGTVIHAIATIENYDEEEGLISEMVIRPA